MKRVTIIVEDAEIVKTWLQLLDLEHLVSVLVENVEPVAASATYDSPWGKPRNRPDAGHPRMEGVSIHHLIADTFFDKGPFSNADARKVVEREGYAPNSVNSGLSRLCTHGFASKSLNGYTIKRKVPANYSFRRAEYTKKKDGEWDHDASGRTGAHSDDTE